MSLALLRIPIILVLILLASPGHFHCLEKSESRSQTKLGRNSEAMPWRTFTTH